MTTTKECEPSLSTADIDIILYEKSGQDGFRWIVLLIVCICVFSLVYSYENPFALQSKLEDENAYNLSPVEYNLLYGIYGYVNVIVPLIAALLIDYIGLNSASLLFYTIAVIGQTIWVFGCMQSSYPLMILGRGIFGGGTQSFQTSRKYYYYEYFIGKEYAFAAGLTLFASRSASAVQSYVTTFIFKTVNKDRNEEKYIINGVVAALSVGWTLVMLSLILFISFFVYSRCKYSNNDIKTRSSSLPHMETENKPLIATETSSRSKFNLPGLWKGAFDTRFWILTLALMCFYASYRSFTTIGSSLLQQRYDMSYERGNALAPIPLFMSAFAIPICGFITDKYGKRCQLLTLSALLLTISHLILGFAPSDMNEYVPIIGLVCFGVGMSIGSAILWPSVGLICTKQYLATALGFVGCLDNGFLGTSSLIIGVLTRDEDTTHRYQDVSYWSTFLSVLMLLCVLLLWYFDKKRFNNVLNQREAKFNKENEIYDVELADKGSLISK